MFDEKFSSLQSMNAVPVRLSAWYPNKIMIQHIAFVCGPNEEIALVDDQARIRIYSLITQQFRLVTEFSSPRGFLCSSNLLGPPPYSSLHSPDQFIRHQMVHVYWCSSQRGLSLSIGLHSVQTRET
jgi:hypothetical protein